jgi:death on curing protein
LARPQQTHAYDPDVDLARLAAAYAFGLARSHPYRDGTKRIAFLALADGRVTEEQLARWIRDRLVR